MVKDKRHSSRHPVLLRSVVICGTKRLDTVCTDTSPTGAFFATQTPPPLGASITMDVRHGVDATVVRLHAVVTRATLASHHGPAGFGVAWRAATCESGTEPLFRFLRKELGITGKNDAASIQGNATYVFCAGPDRAAETPAPCLESTAVPSATAGVLNFARRPAQNPLELDPQTARPPLAAGDSRQPPIARRDTETIGLLDTLGVDESLSLDAPPAFSTRSGKAPSPAWPIQALLPAERSSGSTPAHTKPALPPVVRRGAVEVAAESIAAPPASRTSFARRRHPSPQPQTASAAAQPVPPVRRPLVRPVAPPPAAPAPEQDSGRLLAPANVPITYVRDNRFCTGQLTAIGEHVACVVTPGAPPEPGEVLVIQLQVRVDADWRSMQLTGRTHRVATDTPEGKRFVMHIERIEEGSQIGAFQAFLSGLKGL